MRKLFLVLLAMPAMGEAFAQASFTVPRAAGGEPDICALTQTMRGELGRLIANPPPQETGRYAQPIALGGKRCNFDSLNVPNSLSCSIDLDRASFLRAAKAAGPCLAAEGYTAPAMKTIARQGSFDASVSHERRLASGGPGAKETIHLSYMEFAGSSLTSSVRITWTGSTAGRAHVAAAPTPRPVPASPPAATRAPAASSSSAAPQPQPKVVDFCAANKWARNTMPDLVREFLARESGATPATALLNPKREMSDDLRPRPVYGLVTLPIAEVLSCKVGQRYSSNYELFCLGFGPKLYDTVRSQAASCLPQLGMKLLSETNKSGPGEADRSVHYYESRQTVLVTFTYDRDPDGEVFANDVDIKWSIDWPPR